MYGAPCPSCGGAGLLRALAALSRADTGAVWRLSRCSLVFCFSLEVTRARIRSVSGCGWGVVYVLVPCWALSEVFHVDDRYRPVGGSSGP